MCVGLCLFVCMRACVRVCAFVCVCLGNVYADVPVHLCLHNKLVISCHDMFVTAFLYNVFFVCLPVCAFLSVRDRMCLCVWLCLLVCLSVQAYGISMPGCFWLCLFRICVCLCSQCCRCTPLHVIELDFSAFNYVLWLSVSTLFTYIFHSITLAVYI